MSKQVYIRIIISLFYRLAKNMHCTVLYFRWTLITMLTLPISLSQKILFSPFHSPHHLILRNPCTVLSCPQMFFFLMTFGLEGIVWSLDYHIQYTVTGNCFQYEPN